MIKVNNKQNYTNKKKFSKIPISLKYYQHIVTQDLLLKQNCKNIMELPKLNKIVFNISSNIFVQDKKYIIPALLALESITGQKIKSTQAKKSIASFKIREGQVLGCKITLRTQNMYNFFSKFIIIITSRIRDLSAVNKDSSFISVNSSLQTKKYKKNSNNNLYFTLAIKNLMIFPELENHFELFSLIKGLNITFEIYSKKSNYGRLLCSAFQIPILI